MTLKIPKCITLTGSTNLARRKKPDPPCFVMDNYGCCAYLWFDEDYEEWWCTRPES